LACLSFLFFSPKTSSEFVHIILRILIFFLFLSSQYFLCTCSEVIPYPPHSSSEPFSIDVSPFGFIVKLHRLLGVE
jgi:hypothetical protein